MTRTWARLGDQARAYLTRATRNTGRARGPGCVCILTGFMRPSIKFRATKCLKPPPLRPPSPWTSECCAAGQTDPEPVYPLTSPAGPTGPAASCPFKVLARAGASVRNARPSLALGCRNSKSLLGAGALGDRAAGSEPCKPPVSVTLSLARSRRRLYQITHLKPEPQPGSQGLAESAESEGQKCAAASAAVPCRCAELPLSRYFRCGIRTQALA